MKNPPKRIGLWKELQVIPALGCMMVVAVLVAFIIVIWVTFSLVDAIQSLRNDATLRALWIARFEGGVVGFILGAIVVALDVGRVWRPTLDVASSAAEDDGET
jgi:hypothetical protein